MPKLPIHARFEAYLDSNKWKTNIPEFIDTYRRFLQKRNEYISLTSIAPADVLLERARTLFNELKGVGKSIPADVLVEPVKAAAPRLPSPKKNNTLEESESEESESEESESEDNSNVSPDTLAAIAAAEEAEKAGSKAPLAPTKPIPVPPKRPAASASASVPLPAPVPLEAIPHEGALIGAVPGIVPASCGRMTPEFIERWIADNYSHLPQGDPYGTKHVEIHPAFNSEFEIKRTVGDGTCLLHAFLTDVSPTYRRMTKRAKETVGAAFRKNIYAMLYPPDARMRIQYDDYRGYRSRPSIDAKVVARGNNRYIAEGFEDELYDALARAYIRDTAGYLYDDDIEKLRACFKIRIIIVTKNDVSHDIFRLGPFSPEELAAEFEREREINAENGYTRYIMIYQSGVHYEAVRRKNTDQYIFIYPEVQDIIEASRGAGIDTRGGLKALFTQGIPVTIKTEEGVYIDLIVSEDEVHYDGVIDDIPQVDQVYLEPADHSVAPRLYPIGDIVTVNGRGFRAANYQVAASPGSPQGRRGTPAPSSATPELLPYNARFPAIRVVTSKRKGATKRKSKSPSPSPSPKPRAKTFTWRKPKSLSTTVANTTAKLANAKAKLAEAVAALAKAKKNRKTKKKTSP